MTGTLVFLVSIVDFPLFFDGMLGDRRCAVGIISSMVGPDYSVILQARNPKMMRVNSVGAWNRDGEEKRNEEKSVNVGEIVLYCICSPY